MEEALVYLRCHFCNTWQPPRDPIDHLLALTNNDHSHFPIMNAMQLPAPERLRPVTWHIWFAWVLVAAFVPVLSSIAATAFGKEISRHAQHRGLIMWGLFAITALAILAPPLMQGLVLKRVFPKLRISFWFLCVLLSGIAWIALTQFQHHGSDLIKAGFRTQVELQSAARAQSLAGTLTVGRIIALPWGPFLLWTIAVSALTSLVPVWMLGAMTGFRRATLLLFVASIVGATASGIVEQLYRMSFEYGFRNDWALNGLSWTYRFQMLALRSGVGAVWGAIAAIFVVLMIPQLGSEKAPNTPILGIHRVGGLALVLLAPLLIAFMAPFAGYLIGPRGVVVGAPDLRKAISFAPSHDRSQGETVLTYSHDIAVPTGRNIGAVIAPDGRTAIVRSVDHKLMQVDLITGGGVRQLAQALTPLERHFVVWSPDGRYLALRSNGTEVLIPGTHYKRHQSRVRLYALPDFTSVGEFSNSDGTCFDTYAREPMLFAKNSRSLWLVCGKRTAPKPDDLMAIRLDVPTMQTLDLRRYGEGAESGQARGLELIGDSIWAWQSDYRGKPFRVRDLTLNREIVAVQMPMDLIGKMTAQTNRHQVDEKSIRLSFCGAPPRAPVNAGPEVSICRTLTFETMTGTLTGSADESDYRWSSPNAPRASLPGHGLRIESFWRADSKTGELVVRDIATGRERQRIVSIAQSLLRMSSDGRWLITGGVDNGRLRIYRIQH